MRRRVIQKRRRAWRTFRHSWLPDAAAFGPPSVEAIARVAGTSRRSLLRRFRDAAGESPIAWLTRERIARARDLLETTDAGIVSISDAVGFGAPETFRHHFKRHIGVSPNRYREQFRSGG